MFGASKSGKAAAAGGGGATVTDAQIKYVTTLLNGDGTNGAQNNTFVDSSTNNFTVTRNGNATQGTVSPFGANWSNYFNGNISTYIKLGSAATVFPVSSANYTIEGWFNISVMSSTVGLACFGDLFEMYIGSSGTSLNVEYRHSAGPAWAVNTSAFTFAVGTWYHIAVVISSGSLRCYVNGTAVGSASTGIGNPAWGGSGFDGFLIGVNDVYPFGSLDSSLNGYVSNFRITKSAVYTSNFTPSTAPLTAVTDTSLLTCQSPSFQDNSANAYAITMGGTPQVQRFSPFSNVTQTPQSYSTKFNGTSDYFTVPANTGLTLGAGDFTVEFWLYVSALPNTRTNITYFNANTSGYAALSLQITSGNKLGLSISESGGGWKHDDSTGVGSAITAGVWQHVAIVRSGQNVQVYLGGVAQGAAYALTSAGTSLMTTYTLNQIGVYNSGYYYFSGCISNLRIVKGTAVYTANFTPSTTPLTAITNTALLTCQDATIKDNSTNAFAITATGSPTPKTFNPFGYATSTTQSYDPSVNGGSMYFDGSGDYLTVSNTAILSGAGNFTIECWVYPTANASGKCILGAANWELYLSGFTVNFVHQGVANYNSSLALTPNTWNHVVVEKYNYVAATNGGYKTFVNGIMYDTGSPIAGAGSALSADTILTLGCSYYTNTPRNYWDGYISNLRIVKGTAVYTANFTPPAAPLTAITNTQLLLNGTNAGIYDSAMQTVFETVGNAQISTTQKKYGTGSMYFDGSGDYLSFPTGANNDFGTGDFTIEMWINPSSLTNYNMLYAGGGYLALVWGATASVFGLNANNGVQDVSSTTATIPINQWTHIAFVRSSGTLYFYINGVASGSGGFSSAFGSSSVAATLAFNPVYAASGYYTNAYIDDFRITKGYARYTANFTPPTAALPTS